MTLPSWASAWLLARESDEPALALLTITHPDWAADQRLALNTEDVVSNGDTYAASYFSLDIVTDTDQPPRATLTIPNVSPEIGRLCMTAARSGMAPTVRIDVVSSAHLDEPFYTAEELQLRSIKVTPLTVSGDLTSRDYSSEICGSIRVVPSKFPALFLVR